MRRYDEPIDVRSGRIGADIAGLDADQLDAHPEGPAQFVWRNRLWRVLGVQTRWVESGAWWTGPAVRAARGDDATRESQGAGQDSHGGLVMLAEPIGGSFADEAFEGDLLCEHEVWRVEAANGRHGSRGVYELAHSWSDGRWTLRASLD